MQYHSMPVEQIIIAGGGIAGMAAAIGLSRHGHAIRVCERSSSFSEIGAGIQIGPNAVRALQAIGAWDAVEPTTVRPPSIRIMSGLTGKLIQMIDLGRYFDLRYAAPYRVAHRADLHGALTTVARAKSNIALELGCAVTDTASNCLIAADGVRSHLRDKMFSGVEAIHLPYTIHRTMMPPGACGTEHESVHLWLFAGGHIVHYPVKDGRINVVSVTDGLDAPLPSSNIAKVFGTGHSQEWSTWPALVAPPLAAWHSGSTCLIGDAAHGTLPFLAQGAAMALEDAAALTEAFAMHAQNSERFSNFSSRRQKRTHHLHRQTIAMGRVYHLRGAMAAARNVVLKATPGSMALQSVDWIYREN